MYIAKRDGKGGYRLFEESMHAEALERLELRADLQRAVDSDQFELHYQPVVRLDDMSVSGVEALIRWHHPTRGVIAADRVHPHRRGHGADRADRAAGCCARPAAGPSSCSACSRTTRR